MSGVRNYMQLCVFIANLRCPTAEPCCCSIFTVFGKCNRYNILNFYLCFKELRSFVFFHIYFSPFLLCIRNDVVNRIIASCNRRTIIYIAFSINCVEYRSNLSILHFFRNVFKCISKLCIIAMC